MLSILLVGHVMLAVLALIFAGGVVYSTSKHNLELANNHVKRMWQSTVTVLLSGIVLTIVTSVPIGRVCATMTAFISVILLVHAYNKNVRASLSSK